MRLLTITIALASYFATGTGLIKQKWKPSIGTMAADRAPLSRFTSIVSSTLWGDSAGWFTTSDLKMDNAPKSDNIKLLMGMRDAYQRLSNALNMDLYDFIKATKNIKNVLNEYDSFTTEDKLLNEIRAINFSHQMFASQTQDTEIINQALEEKNKTITELRDKIAALEARSTSNEDLEAGIPIIKNLQIDDLDIREKYKAAEPKLKELSGYLGSLFYSSEVGFHFGKTLKLLSNTTHTYVQNEQFQVVHIDQIDNKKEIDHLTQDQLAYVKGDCMVYESTQQLEGEPIDAINTKIGANIDDKDELFAFLKKNIDKIDQLNNRSGQLVPPLYELRIANDIGKKKVYAKAYFNGEIVRHQFQIEPAVFNFAVDIHGKLDNKDLGVKDIIPRIIKYIMNKGNKKITDIDRICEYESDQRSYISISFIDDDHRIKLTDGMSTKADVLSNGYRVQ